MGVDHIGPVGEDGGGLVCADQEGPVGLDHWWPVCSDCKRVRARLLQLAVKVLQCTTKNTYMSDIITFFINKFDGGVGRIKKSFNLFIMSLSHGVSSFDDKDKIFEASANTLKDI